MNEKPTETIPEILDAGDLAELLRVNRQTILRYINANKLPACRIVPGKYLVTKERLIEFINKGSQIENNVD